MTLADSPGCVHPEHGFVVQAKGVFKVEGRADLGRIEGVGTHVRFRAHEKGTQCRPKSARRVARFPPHARPRRCRATLRQTPASWVPVIFTSVPDAVLVCGESTRVLSRRESMPAKPDGDLCSLPPVTVRPALEKPGMEAKYCIRPSGLMRTHSRRLHVQDPGCFVDAGCDDPRCMRYGFCRRIGREPSRAGLRSAGGDLRYPEGGARRRLFLGRAGRLPASQGREERVVRLCRRRT